jgi:hypothetical protein
MRTLLLSLLYLLAMPTMASPQAPEAVRSMCSRYDGSVLVSDDWPARCIG